MACTILVRATDLDDLVTGHAVSVYDVPHVWGNLVRLPNWVHFVISDSNRDEMRFLLSDWLTEFAIALQSQNPARFRYRVTVQTQWVAPGGDGGVVFRDEMERYFEDKYDGTIVNPGSTTNILVDIPKNPTPPPEEKILDDFNDKFHDIFSRARWILPSAEVATIVAEGGDKIYSRTQSNDLWVDLIA